MSDSIHRRKPISLIVLMSLLVSFVLPFASARPSVVQAAPSAPTSAAPTARQTPQAPNAPTSVTLAGSLQSELGCPGDWAPECATTHMIYDAADDVWQFSGILSGTFDYKAAIDNSWDVNYGAGGVLDGPNIGLTLPTTTTSTVKFYYDDKSHWITSDKNVQIATAVGSFQFELGCSDDSQADCLRSWLQDLDGDGIYTFSSSAIPAGNYEFKVALNESDTVSYPANPVPFTVGPAGNLVVITWDSATNAVTVNVTALGDTIQYAWLRHDSRSDVYRTPYGAVPMNTPVTLRFRTFHDDVTGVRVRFYDSASSAQFIREMTPAATNTDCYDDTVIAPRQAEPPAQTCDFWTTSITPTQRGILYYRFIVNDGTATAYYEDDARLDGGLGAAVPVTSDRSYNIYIYEPGFQTPEWSKNAVIYQIFVERFRNGDATNDPTADPAATYPGDTAPTRGWFYPEERAHRFPITPWNTIVPDPEPFAVLTNTWRLTYSSTMYGGDLKGIQDKLAYLKSLGVTTLYLNPIFDSPSNHKYDGRDYRTVDPAFGGPAAFAALATAAHAEDMYIILDGVPNHVSSDSPFFDRFGRHTVLGACESNTSTYRSWFFFQDVPAGTGECMSNAGVANAASYTGWFGVETLPQINTAHPEVMAYWFGTPGGNPNLPDTNTAAYWVDGNDKADGWRIDVVPDVVGVNSTFFETWRTTMKAANPDAVLYSETWSEGDVRERVLGEEFDSTMNYRYRRALLGFLRDTRFVDNDGGQEIDPLSPTQFVDAFRAFEEDYPKPAFDAAMNLLGSHDTNRPVHVLNELGFTGTGSTREPVDGFADARKRLSMVAVLQMTLPGAPTIYYGDEVGLTGYGSDVNRDDPYNRQPYPWDDQAGYGTLPAWRKAQTDLLGHYQALGTLRGDHTFLRTGSFDPLLTNDDTKVLAYGRKDETGAGIVVMNRSNVAITAVLDLKHYIPNGTVLRQTMPLTMAGNLAAFIANTYQFQVPANSYGIWITPAGTDLVPTAAPTNLVATPGNAVVQLSWNAVAGAASYNVYRSTLSGGGFTLVDGTASLTYNDTGVTNGTRYYYIVKAVDGVGNESDASNEVSATPAFPIGYAVLQFPKDLSHVLGVTPTNTIYGQVYVAGVTDQVVVNSGLILAQVGYGAQGSNASAWATWTPMSFNVKSGNNYEYQGKLRPESVGVFDMLVRFSTDNGLTWTYGDRNGIGTATPGTLTVTANPDSTPPAAPQNLRVSNWSDDFIVLEWNSVADAALYRLYRSTITGTFDFNSPLVEVVAPTLIYTDTTVVGNATYHYVVKAYDAALNASVASNEVSQTASPKLVQVTFNVTVPNGTPGTIYIVGNNEVVFGATWNPGFQPITQVATNTWQYQVTLLDGTTAEYKYTRGSWDKVEKEADGNTEIVNRQLQVEYGTTGVQVVNDVVANWRDPLVAAVSPAADATNVAATTTIAVTWNQAMPTDTNFSVTGFNGAVAGSFGYDNSTRTVIFTPSVALQSGRTYTVTVAGKVDVNGDVQQVAKVWSFTVAGNIQYKLFLPLVRKNN